MKIKIKLFATLRKDRFDESDFEIEMGENIEHIFNRLGLKQDEVAIIFINGRHADYTTPVSDGDDIAFFPPIGGG